MRRKEKKKKLHAGEIRSRMGKWAEPIPKFFFLSSPSVVDIAYQSIRLDSSAVYPCCSKDTWLRGFVDASEAGNLVWVIQERNSIGRFAWWNRYDRCDILSEEIDEVFRKPGMNTRLKQDDKPLLDGGRRVIRQSWQRAFARDETNEFFRNARVEAKDPRTSKTPVAKIDGNRHQVRLMKF